MSNDSNYYERLGLTDSADGTAVNRTYWQLARKYQALAPSDPRARQMLDELNEAYNTLGTPTLREAYDRTLALAPPTEQARPNEAPKGGTRRTSVKIAAPVAFIRTRSYNWPALSGALAGLAVIALGLATGSIWCGVLGVATAATSAFAPLSLGIARRWRSDRVRALRGLATASIRATAKTAVESARPASKAPKRAEADAEELRSSTASMVSRWRTTVASGTESSQLDRTPDSTLVDIFRSEHDLETQSEPLSAVLDVLRGSRPAVESK